MNQFSHLLGLAIATDTIYSGLFLPFQYFSNLGGTITPRYGVVSVRTCHDIVIGLVADFTAVLK